MNRLLATLAALALLGSCGDDSLRGLEGGPHGAESAPPCTTSLDCGAGLLCEAGHCVAECVAPCTVDPTDPTDPTDSPGQLPLYVGGQWRTEYHLDLSNYLGPLADLGTPLDQIDQLLMGNIDLPFIDAIIAQYVPPWVGELVHLLNSLVHFFQDVRIDARMSLAHVSGAPTELTGSEIWDWGYVRVIDGCPYGESDPGYPDCALVAVPLGTYGASFGVVGVEARPFAGSISGAVLSVSGREVRMQIAQFLRFIVDRLIDISTGGQYTSLAAAMAGLVNCPGLQVSIESALGQSFPWINGVCVAAVNEVAGQLAAELDAVTVDWELMRFDQRATAYDDDGDGNGDRLGAPPSAPGSVDGGELQLLFGAGFAGTWFGTRP